MIKQTLSTFSASRVKSDVEKLERNKETNAQWLRHAYESFALEDANNWSFIVLAGG